MGTQSKLEVYRDLFEAIIASDDVFGPALRKVKDIYDACAHPHVQQKVGTLSSSQTEMVRPTRGSKRRGERDLGRHEGLKPDNRVSRNLVCEFHFEREELRAGRANKVAHPKHERPPADCSNGDDWAVLAGLLPLGGG